ncbi:leukocyte cell-derived chemotaxin-2 [Parambassis ranga]|uniref:Leukocyte cell-derived chemotaxin-2 n=1 Tax=Parambassis ranga TaxID=210632 RepID=A0A6P7IHW6_9TELE|nr:leukocyte cell-derived chemotaxin-2 [Parambassis ranga]
MRMRRVLVLLAVLCVSEAVRFGQLCAGNPTNTRRTSDRHGQGHYGAGRGGRTHEGLDIVCDDGSAVYAPFDVSLQGGHSPYRSPSNKQVAINQGIRLRGEGLCFSLFYVRPDRVSGSVRRGERLGTLLPMQSVYPGITSHIHVQMCDRSDPTPHF